MKNHTFNVGDVYETPNDCGVYTAGIHCDDWQHRIEVYGLSIPQTTELRDFVLEAVKHYQAFLLTTQEH